MNTNTFVFHESFGHMPKALLTLLKRHNVTPSDYMMLQFQFCEDWDRIADFITANLRGKSFLYPFGV